MKKLHLWLIVLILMVPAAVSAQEIYGRVWLKSSGQPAGGAAVQAECGSGVQGGAVADNRGFYNITVSGNFSQCTLSVVYQGRNSNSVSVYTGDRTRANLELSAAGNRWLMVRR